MRASSSIDRCREAGRRVRGSVLLVSMVLAIGIAIALSTMISLVLNSRALADRTCYQNAAMNLAEVGVEEALYCFNKLEDVPRTSPQDAWTPYGWTVAGDNSATRTLTGFTPGPGVEGVVKVYCSRYNPTSLLDTPMVVAKVTLTFPSGPPVIKCLEVTMRKRSLFPRGMVVRQTIDADGGSVCLDSWDSADDGDPATPLVAYSVTSRRANATLATLNANPSVQAIDVGNGTIYGYIATAGAQVHAGSTAILTGDFASSAFDTQRISYDYEVTAFPLISPPSRSATNNVTSNMGAVALPRAGDVAASDGYYYYNFAPGSSISLNGGTLQVNAKVVLILNNHASVGAITIGGGGGIGITSGGALKVYSNGNIDVSGLGGLSNANSEPSTCVFFGTDTSIGGQTINLRGNGETSVSLYAPNAGITIYGGGSGGDFYGAIVGNTVRMNGNTRFHYDEALARLYTGKPFGVAKWRELHTPAERDVYSAQLNF